ncbi:LysR family transcriptional regulator [Hoeflea poritis]|uniref:LysR family transcriptional regulator n=1 Tax=Hoeflea poritis TaxID=2993659 RepID=A0ABT4VRF1_9HYPH|nr:LysR family transcriptional regulator [Hoeflea poritis]MDA4847292.1 LysR family transcriptional regulator [Hoeflea poritis]
MPLDWDKLRIFHAAAEAGSFTHAAEKLHLSQSAISRQVSALEQDIGVPLFHRHARGLILTEQGELLYRTAHDVLLKLEAVRVRLSETTDKPSGKLRVTTTVGLGSGWLTDRMQEFMELYPDIEVQLLLDNEELDVSMRHADCAIRLRQPQQPDLIQRKLFTVHMHVYASPAYLNRYGKPEHVSDFDGHRIITFGEPAPNYLLDVNWLEVAGRPASNPRSPHLQINNMPSIKRAAQLGIGLAMLPDYMVGHDAGLVQLDIDADVPSFSGFFCYPEELRGSAKLKAFRDFLISKARNWKY